MLKVLAAALIGTVAGVAVMVIVIVATGSTTDNASSVGLTSPGAATTPATTPPAATGTGTTGGGTTGGGGGGNAANGKAVFSSAGCSSCHTFTAAGSSGTIGPNLDSLAGNAKKAGQPLDTYIHDSIVTPNAFISPGYQANIMPQTFGTSLSASDIADLVAFLSQNQK
jgi:cytochrome c551/c552